MAAGAFQRLGLHVEASIAAMNLDLDAIGLSLIPGPSDGPDITDSQAVLEIAEIECGDIARALLELPGARVTTPEAPPTSWAWRAVLESDDARIELEMTLLEPDHRDVMWGGFGLHGHASTSALVRIARHLASRCGAVWVHDNQCRMWRPDAFGPAVIGGAFGRGRGGT